MKNKNSKPTGLLEHLDAYTGAPTRAAIAKLQGDFTDLPGAASAAIEQFGADPKEAPTGQQLASNIGLTGISKTLAGLGLELAADPTSAITGGAKLAMLPLVGMKALKAADVVGDVARVANAADDVADAAKLLDKSQDVVKAADSTQDAIKAAKEASSDKFWKQAVKGQELAAEQAIVNQVNRPFLGTGGIVHAPTAESGAKLASQNPSEWGRVIQLPDLMETRRMERAAKAANARFPAVRNIIRGRK